MDLRICKLPGGELTAYSTGSLQGQSSHMPLQYHSGSQYESSDHQTGNENAQSQMQTIQYIDRRAVYMIVNANTPFKAHWAYFYPEKAETTGSVVHVTGDVRGGFEHEIKRNYDHELSSSRHQLFKLGEVDSSDLFLDAHGTDSYRETVPRCAFERALFSAPAPGPSLNSALGPVCICSHTHLLTR